MSIHLLHVYITAKKNPSDIIAVKNILVLRLWAARGGAVG
jgi:hypothetical protein